jgi:hypothetical protein
MPKKAQVDTYELLGKEPEPVTAVPVDLIILLEDVTSWVVKHSRCGPIGRLAKNLDCWLESVSHGLDQLYKRPPSWALEKADCRSMETAGTHGYELPADACPAEQDDPPHSHAKSRSHIRDGHKHPRCRLFSTPEALPTATRTSSIARCTCRPR